MALLVALLAVAVAIICVQCFYMLRLWYECERLKLGIRERDRSIKTQSEAIYGPRYRACEEEWPDTINA